MEEERKSSQLPTCTHSNSDYGKTREDLNIADYSTKGIFGPEGLLAALALEEGSSSSSQAQAQAQDEPTSLLHSIDNDNSSIRYKKAGQPTSTSTDPDPQSGNVELGMSLCRSENVAEATQTEVGIELCQDYPCSPAETAFSIDHIRESILSTCDLTALFKCRLVCQRWAFYVSKDLQKLLSLGFYGEKEKKCKLQSQCTSFVLHRPTLLPSLTALLSNPAATTQFPVTSFTCYLYDKENDMPHPDVQSFLYAHGCHLKKLELIGRSRSTSPGSASVQMSKSIFFEDIERLVLLQAVNLEHLILRGNITVALQLNEMEDCYARSLIEKSKSVMAGDATDVEDDEDMDDEGEDEDEEDEETADGLSLYKILDLNIKITDWCRPTSILRSNLKLKTLEFCGLIPQNIFKNICKCSPNLVRVDLHKNENLLHCLANPKRLHLIKILRLKRVSKKILKSLEKMVEGQEVYEGRSSLNLAPKELIVKMSYWLAMQPTLWNRTAEVMSRILKASCASCECIVWEEMGFLKRLVVPQMSAIKKLELKFYDIPSAPRTQFFPEEMSFAQTFPNVEIVTLTISGNFPLTHVLNKLEVMPRVREFKCSIGSGHLVDSFREMFPNAQFSRF